IRAGAAVRRADRHPHRHLRDRQLLGQLLPQPPVLPRTHPLVRTPHAAPAATAAGASSDAAAARQPAESPGAATGQHAATAGTPAAGPTAAAHAATPADGTAARVAAGHAIPRAHRSPGHRQAGARTRQARPQGQQEQGRPPGSLSCTAARIARPATAPGCARLRGTSLPGIPRMRRLTAAFAAILLGAFVVASPALAAGDVTQLQKIDRVVGSGAVANDGDVVQVNYTGWLYDANAADHHGKEFDSSLENGEPIRFTL